MNSSIKKANDILNAIFRNLPYPIIRKIAKFPPVQDSLDGHMLLLVARPKDFWNAIWAAYSACLLHPKQFQVKLIIDGQIGEKEKAIFSILFQSSILTEIHAYIPFLHEGLRPEEGYSKFILNQPFARKMAAVILESQNNPLLYIDSDILFFKPSPEIQTWLCDESKVYYLEDPPWCAADPWLIKQLEAVGIEYRKGLNAGFLTVPKNAIPLNMVREVFSGWGVKDMNWTTDQIYFSSILLSYNAIPLDNSKYLNNSNGYFLFGERDKVNNKVIMRHYIGTIRRLLYLQGMPIVYNQVKFKGLA